MLDLRNAGMRAETREIPLTGLPSSKSIILRFVFYPPVCLENGKS